MKTTCGIIGSGVIAPSHAEGYKALESTSLDWACDLDETKAKGLAEKYSIPNITTDYRHMLADPALDCVSVCTDHASHAQIVTDALDAGKHVVCEKPLAANQEGLDQMTLAHQRNKHLVFSGVFQHRFSPVNAYLKELIDKDVLGRILTANVRHAFYRSHEYYTSSSWRGTWNGEGGAAMINQSIHFVDQINWLMGGIDSLCSSWANITHKDVCEAEDTAVFSLRFKNGALGTYAAMASSNLGWDSWIGIFGDKGSVELLNGEPSRISFSDEKLQKEVNDGFNRRNTNGDAVTGKAYYGPHHIAQIADFVGAVQNGCLPYVTGESAREAVDIVLGVYRSQRDQSWVSFKDI